jgi:putative colanic acid biosynthesis glycosyltransferase
VKSEFTVSHRNKKPTGEEKRGGYIKQSASGSPLISVITAVLNARNDLENAIKEVQGQTYANVEHIIIDGGSTDGTAEVLRRNDAEVDYWISEADMGIYDAMNKGVEAAAGEWIYFLGADDAFYSPDTLRLIFEDQWIPDEVAVLLGSVMYPDGRLFKSRFAKSMYFKNTIHHQGVFYRYNLFEGFRYGASASAGSARHYYISGDYQLNFMLFLQGAQYVHVNQIIAKCGRGLSMQGKLLGYLEEISIRHEYLGFFKAMFFDAFTLLRYLYKRIVKTALRLGSQHVRQ